MLFPHQRKKDLITSGLLLFYAAISNHFIFFTFIQVYFSFHFLQQSYKNWIITISVSIKLQTRRGNCIIL